MKNIMLSDALNKRSTNINILRFFAAILVIISHAPVLTRGISDPCYYYTQGQISLGGIAVAIFFFLSGVYVTNSMYKRNDLKLFLKKRCERLFPQLWIVVLLTVLVLGPIFTSLGAGEYFADKATWKYLLNGIMIPIHELPGVFATSYNTSINGPLWTLPVEFIAYLILALVCAICNVIFKKGTKKAQFVIHIIGAVLLLGAMAAATRMFEDPEFIISVIRPMVLFFIGAIYADCKDKIRLLWPVGLIMLIILFAAAKTALINYLVILFLPYVIVSLVMATKQIKTKTRLFDISYEMYLVGFPIQHIVVELAKVDISPLTNMLISIPVDIVIAFLLYIATEKILSARKNKK